MKHLSSTTIAMAFAAAIIAGPAKAEGPACREMLSAAMIENSCAASMQLEEKYYRQDGRSCSAMFVNRDSDTPNVMRIVINRSVNADQARKSFQRLRGLVEKEATAEGQAKSREEYKPVTVRIDDVPEASAGAWLVTIENEPGKNKFLFNALVGMDQVNLASDYTIGGKTIPCDAEELKTLGTAVLNGMGG